MATLVINKYNNKYYRETEQGVNFTKIFGKTGESEIWEVFGGCFIFMVVSVFALACLMLKFDNGYVVTANAFVEPYNYRQKDFISFSDTQLIKRCGNRHEFRTQPNTQKGDCIVVEYRRNPIVYHFREVKNLGAMSKQECFAQITFQVA